MKPPESAARDEWLSAHKELGLIDDAVRHAIAAGDTTKAAGLVEEHLTHTLRRGERGILERRLSALPADEVRSRPALSFALAEIQFHLGRLSQVDRFLSNADSALASGDSGASDALPTDAGMVREPRAAIALLRARNAGVRGDVDRMVENASVALGALSEEEYGPRFWARWLSEGGASWPSGRLAEAERAAAAMLAEGRVAGRRDRATVAPRAWLFASRCWEPATAAWSGAAEVPNLASVEKARLRPTRRTNVVNAGDNSANRLVVSETQHDSTRLSTFA